MRGWALRAKALGKPLSRTLSQMRKNQSGTQARHRRNRRPIRIHSRGCTRRYSAVAAAVELVLAALLALVVREAVRAPLGAAVATWGAAQAAKAGAGRLRMRPGTSPESSPNAYNGRSSRPTASRMWQAAPRGGFRCILVYPHMVLELTGGTKGSVGAMVVPVAGRAARDSQAATAAAADCIVCMTQGKTA